jgi:hypothetical protein
LRHDGKEEEEEKEERKKKEGKQKTKRTKYTIEKNNGQVYILILTVRPSIPNNNCIVWYAQ